jgi:hypothetical protein
MKHGRKTISMNELIKIHATLQKNEQYVMHSNMLGSDPNPSSWVIS